MTTHATDLLTFGGSAGLVLAYQRYLSWRTRRDPASSAQDVMLAARAAWIASVMRERRDILAVQTLRNSTMSASFMASTAVLLIIGVLTLSAQGDKLSGTWHSLNFLGHASAEMWLFKLLMMLFDLLFAFFSFAMSVRIFHHIGYLINVPLDKANETTQIRKVEVQLNRAGIYYRIGMRAYYFTVPLLFWLFGPIWLLGATLAMVFFMFHLDRAPKHDTDLMG
ncbi:MAG: DUF599 domain-containing protein [Rhodoferax sp.]|uniref:DUF599 domain-containing protein n=1 Tax=Rhodoferax sp. TaxID=50421 RepID=UPI0026308A65|nr:DUF599 domain-containing protein [Rhodoferax sp.]MDD2881759.1 DUF599 domain-containing protein [Rhodoferax sp.]